MIINIKKVANLYLKKNYPELKKCKFVSWCAGEDVAIKFNQAIPGNNFSSSEFPIFENPEKNWVRLTWAEAKKLMLESMSSK